MREINGFGPWFGPARAKTKPLIFIFGRLFFRPFFLRKKKGQEKINGTSRRTLIFLILNSPGGDGLDKENPQIVALTNLQGKLTRNFLFFV